MFNFRAKLKQRLNGIDNYFVFLLLIMSKNLIQHSESLIKLLTSTDMYYFAFFKFYWSILLVAYKSDLFWVLLAGEAHSLKVEKILYQGRSEFQEILVFEVHHMILNFDHWTIQYWFYFWHSLISLYLYSC